MEVKNLSGMRQDLARKLVEREVVHTANYLMQGITHLMSVVGYDDWREAFREDQDETRHLFERYDYEEAARLFVKVDADLDDLEAVADEYGYWSDVLRTCSVPDGEDDMEEYLEAHPEVEGPIREAVWALVEGAHDDAFKEVCEEHSLEVEPQEVYEHWIVSDWLGRKLKARGEVVQDFAGFTLWGRCTTGQAICMDGVIEEITAETWPSEWSGEAA